MFRENRRGFTLIELLIVVAIIAILAAIAVPNFLEAQTRAKVSRAKSDMRNITTAVESYYVDYSRYPFPGTHEGVMVPSPFEDHMNDTHIPITLTTPTAYIPVLALDPFQEGGHQELYHYTTRAYQIAHEGDALEFDLVGKILADIPRGGSYYFVLSNGPDNIHNIEDEGLGDGSLYDPSNGTLSTGDIIYWGGHGLKN